MIKRTLITISIFGLMLQSCSSTRKVVEKIIYIGAETKPCQLGELQASCLQVKWEKDQQFWESFGQTTEIDGFAYEKGYEYELLISETKIENAPADASSIKYKLVKQLNRTKK